VRAVARLLLHRDAAHLVLGRLARVLDARARRLDDLALHPELGLLALAPELLRPLVVARGQPLGAAGGDVERGARLVVGELGDQEHAQAPHARADGQDGLQVAQVLVRHLGAALLGRGAGRMQLVEDADLVNDLVVGCA
jgi:hypothetical protein